MIDKNPKKIQNMFNEIAPCYDFFNNIMTFGIHKLIKSRSVNMLKIKENDKILDVCTGTGDILGIISKKYPKTELFGIDFSTSMLDIAHSRLNKNIELIEASATSIPYLDNSFDKITITFGLRNIEEEKLATNEMNRVLKNGGKLLHLDFGGENRFLTLHLTYM